MADRPFAYVCSPYRGDTEANAEKARAYSRQVYEAGYCPLAPHLLFPQFLKDDISAEREAGMEMGARLLALCRALVVCGDVISEGMAKEIALAEQLRVPVLTLDVFLPETARDRPPAAKPSVLNKIAAARENRAAAPCQSGMEKPKSHGPEL